MIVVNIRLIRADDYYNRVKTDEWEFEELVISTGTLYGNAMGLLIRCMQRREGWPYAEDNRELKDKFCSTIVASSNRAMRGRTNNVSQHESVMVPTCGGMWATSCRSPSFSYNNNNVRA